MMQKFRKKKNMARRVEWEFGGPFGTFALTLGLPLVVVLLWAYCGPHGCSVVPPTFSTVADLTNFISSKPLFTQEALLLVLGWLFFHVVLHLLVPGVVVQGLPLDDGSRYSYRLNGLRTFLIVTVLVISAEYFGVIHLAYLYDIFPQLLSVTMAFSFLMSIYLYAVSFVPGTRVAASGNSGNPFYDFFMGRPFAPFIGPLDLKFFCEQRPGLMAWCLFNLSFALKQYEQHGYVTNSMILVNIFHYIYVFDTFAFESAVLSTMDITTEGFGFMLCFGDLVWVPFTYTVQARYLVDYPVELSTWFGVFLSLMFITGFAIFRLSNSEKDQFRRDPNHPSVKNLHYIKTSQGSRLLISGWWGLARHINYFGDWLHYFASCLACGFDHVIPYFFAVYFAALLFHREIRDDHKCEKKYGDDWVKYRKHVPYRMIPYVY